MRDPGGAEFNGARHGFERTFATWVGAPDAVAFASGRVALSACLHALGIRPGDEVIVPAYTCAVVVNAIAFAGARPVYVDIEHETFGLDVAATTAAITGDTRAILVHHLYGLVSRDLEAVLDLGLRSGIPVIEDCAQSMGARLRGRSVGTFGAAAFFSVGAGKAIEAGQGGLAVAADPARAALLREFQAGCHEVPSDRVADVMATYLLDYAELSAPGRWWRGPAADLVLGGRRVAGAGESELRGEKPEAYESVMPDAVAALALSQLSKLAVFAERRRESARGWSLESERMGLVPPRPVADSTSAFTSFPVLVSPEMKQGRRWAFQRFGVSLATWFSDPPEPGAIVGNPCAADAYRRCVCFPTSVTPRHPESS